jgi:hypothetical protein
MLDTPQAFTVGHSRKMALNLNAGVIAGLGATVLLFALGLLFTALWRRYFTESYYYLEAERASDTSKVFYLKHFSCTSNSSPPFQASLPDWDVESGKERSSIPADMFLGHVATQHSLGPQGFAAQFEQVSLAREKPLPTVVAAHPTNRDKNRYNNVLPCKYHSSLFENPR